MNIPPADSVSPPVTSTESTSPRYDIEYFSFKDLSTDTYWVSIVSDKPQEVIDELNGKGKRKLRIQVGDIRTDTIADTAAIDDDNPSVINFLVSAYYKIPSGKTDIKLFSKDSNSPENLESTLSFDIPLVNDQPGKQPFVEIITPEGGTRGDTITLKGNNFGSDIDKISIILYESAKNKNGEDTYIEIDEKRPFYLSQVINEAQELKFNIPLKKDLMKAESLESL